ncbi:hypothetical protein JCM39068_18250 [Desulfocastanea catecholica]
MITVADLSRQPNTKAACAAFNIPRATYYRHTANLTVAKLTLRLASAPLPLTIAEEQKALDIQHEPRIRDLAASHMYVTLLDEGIYHCSIRTMYRILTKHDEVRERRRQVTRSHYEKPELLATGPNQVWSWDITKLKGPAKWTLDKEVIQKRADVLKAAFNKHPNRFKGRIPQPLPALQEVRINPPPATVIE